MEFGAGGLDAGGVDVAGVLELVAGDDVLGEDADDPEACEEPGLGGEDGYKLDEGEVDGPVPDALCAPQPAINDEAINAMMRIPGVLFIAASLDLDGRRGARPSVREV